MSVVEEDQQIFLLLNQFNLLGHCQKLKKIKKYCLQIYAMLEITNSGIAVETCIKIKFFVELAYHLLLS